ncbi:MAG: bifunctional adenosylcobinamide kinase/adenosylcobinamide-phosphate guanylyltransferase [Selenomonas sp.]|uniref:bifunctional adenosylcobinamide kinase/adenosylcobinamide-phosphate guanylyltransferase n=1 Tax=Selenomonas sp. TaxID=2053611 RepID=UPI0025E640EE|nr:bifunctional adenosylcobinamide kinase/adenosylcobinamide-phosphate guanylyltransferase [Selenomonas sp.]MCR5440465.1 bifunctional adenosylcobinamide kinase/adenosylcobinamide-phosphate guanylyltransferase [Selenomonas sp.]
MDEEKTGKIVLVTGGARSGKSTFAEKIVAQSGHAIAYIATSQIFDEEMRFRVALHRKRRPADWQTYEAPFDAQQAIEAAAKQHDAILFDCITIYLSNILCQLEEQELDKPEQIYALTHQKISQLIAAAQAAAAQGAVVVFVTNEVGAGIVPENKLSRIYRDISGLANQQLAKAAADVYAVIAGIPVNIKALA